MLLPARTLESHPDGTGDLNSIIDANWAILEDEINPTSGLAASQALLVITLSAPFFTSLHVGALILWADGSTAVIASVSDSQHANATVSQTVVSGAFTLYDSAATGYTALARGLTKLTKFISSNDAQMLQWSDSAQRFAMVAKPGYNIAAGRILYGGGTNADLSSSANLTWDNATGIFTVTGEGVFAGSLRSAKVAVSASTATTNVDFKLGNLFDVTLSSNTTIDAVNIRTGAGVWLILRQDATGGRTVAFAAKFSFPNAVTPVVYAAANAVTILFVQASTSTELFGFAAFDFLRKDGGTMSAALTVTSSVEAYRYYRTQASLVYAASVDLDFANREMQTLSLTGDITFTSSNLAAGRSMIVRIVADGTLRNFTFPAWTFVGAAAPAAIAASKTALLRLSVFGATAADVIAQYAVQP